MYLSTNEEINFKHRINKVKRGFSGSHMYGISASASKLAINYLYPLRAHTDGYLNRFLIQKKWGSAKLSSCYVTRDKFGYNNSIEGKVKSTMVS